MKHSKEDIVRLVEKVDARKEQEKNKILTGPIIVACQ